jgi:hypothetical protein
VTDRLIRITTALAVVAADVAAVISYQHAYELVRSHAGLGRTVRLVPFTVDGLIWAASMVVRHGPQDRVRLQRHRLPGRAEFADQYRGAVRGCRPRLRPAGRQS